MEKPLDTVEKIAWPLAILGFAAKWALVSAGNYLLLAGLGSLSVVYFLRSYWPGASAAQPQPGTAGQRRRLRSAEGHGGADFLDDYLRKITGISTAVILMGVLFKLMSWSSGATLLVVGVATMVLAICIAAFKQRLNWFALAIAALGGIMLYVPSETVVRQFHRDDPVLAEKMVYQIQHPSDRAAAADVQQYLQQKRAAR